MWDRAKDSSETVTWGLTPPFLWSIIFSVETKQMSTHTSTTSSGIGFPGLLTVLFIGLKLTGYITWPWVWVLSPMWISALIGLTIIAIVFIIALVTGMFK
jgi:hypothetical protein